VNRQSQVRHTNMQNRCSHALSSLACNWELQYWFRSRW
jgi:hypothetical protein